uniref:Hypoia-responsive family protein 2 n=1 Tax=Rhizophora mucronata TaxID=61149 RepID=A0A2P2JAH5_RHIMU
MSLTLVFMLGFDQLYAIEPTIPLSHKHPTVLSLCWTTHSLTDSNLLFASDIFSLKKKQICREICV